MMNNITSDGGICSNNNSNPSMVSFVGLECNNQKQYGDWETSTHTPTTTNNNNNNASNPNFINPTTNIFDHNFNYPHSSSSSTFASNFNPFSQFPDYPSSNFFKKQEGLDGGLYYNSTDRGIGLNLGHRTYFSSRESTMMDRLIRRPRGFYLENQVPRCQAEGCMIDLTNAKHYHRRHKVCEFHSKATKVVAGGLEQRFCQQCSRFHVLAEFDEAKRSCRKRLADHNRRRRKPHQPGPSDSLLPSAKTSENAMLQVGSSSSASRSEVAQETSLSTSTLSLMISKCTTNNKPIRTSTTTTTNTTTSTTAAKDTLVMTHFMSSSSSNCGPAPALSLAGDQLIRSCNTSTTTTTDHHHHHQSRPFIAMTTHDSTPATLFNNHRAEMMSTTTSTVSSPYHHQNLFFSNVNDSHDHHHHHQALHSTGDGDGSSVDGRNQLHHQEDLHNLLHLRQAMFDVEFV